MSGSPIQHVIVLAMENRSFDHMLGRRFPGPAQHFSVPPLRVASDPPHEFADVRRQLDGHWPHAASAYTRTQLPILNALADNFVTFDRWFSSVPGPTWPNRYFMHAATSGGLVLSPDALHATSHTGIQRRLDLLPLFNGFEFTRGTVFDALDAKRVSWRIYYDDLPQSASLHGLNHQFLFSFASAKAPFRSFARFADDAQRGELPQYTFIEPRYGSESSTFREGNSQHPVGSIDDGEELLKTTYEALRNSPHWENAALLIVYDEHGGFYDSVTPGPALPTGDDRRYAAASTPFDFKRLGFRVPSLLVSPHTEKGAVMHTALEHSAIPRLLGDLFGFAPLTARDAASSSVLALIRRDGFRSDTPTALPEVYRSHEPVAQHPVGSFDRGIATVALGLDALMGNRVDVAGMLETATRSDVARYVRAVRERAERRGAGLV